MKKHKNIPVFIPHLGCPHVCVFCSQTKITGARAASDMKTELAQVRGIIEASLSQMGGAEGEIAFFGGSFTGIEEDRMKAYLECASGYIGGAVGGIRCSTRPDYVNRRICGILRHYGVTAVELGIQSTSQRVLAASGRGHGVREAAEASGFIKEYGFELCGQMMIGLPLSEARDEIQTALDICAYGADACRIYPVVVFENTALYQMMRRGEYAPLSEEDAVRRAAACAKIFIDRGVKILRAGLHSSENLAEAKGGARHPAFGECMEGELYYDAIRALMEQNPPGTETAVIRIPQGELSKCIGHKGINRQRLEAEYKLKFQFSVDGTLQKYSVRRGETTH